MIGCTNNAPKSTYKEDAKEQLAQTDDIERFKLFPTQNMWTFIKLDTQTGQMWQVQYSVKGDEGRFEYDLNPKPLITIGKKSMDVLSFIAPKISITSFSLIG